MKVRSAHALHPLSLLAMALFRGSVAFGNAYHRRIGTAAPCFTVALSNTGTRVASSRTAAALSAATPAATPAATSATAGSTVAQDRGKARKWEIPWGNPDDNPDDGQVEDRNIERTLEALPSAEGVEGSDSFRVMSFNMLAQSMASSKMFTYVPKGQLRKNVRWPRVRDEVCRYGADIICLQECDSYTKILNSLVEKGKSQGTRFEGVYKRRKGNKDGHGVAVLFDSKVFRLLSSDSCDFGRDLFQGVGSFVLLQDRRRQLPPDTCYDTGRGTRGHAGIEGEAAAETVDQGDAAASGVVCVATTHLYWHPDGASIRLAQAEFLVSRLEAFLRERFGDNWHSVPIVLAGDLNNVPGVDVYTLLSTGACDGGTPKAFMRRRLLRAAARRAEKLQKLREANRASAINSDSVSVENVDVGLHKPTEASDMDGSAVEGNTASAPGKREAYAGIGLAKGIPVARPSDRASVATASLPASDAYSAVHASMQVVNNGNDSEQKKILDVPPTIGQVRSEHRQNTGGNPTIATQDGDKDRDVRQYVQGFRGFSSAYGDYSGIFGSQLSDRYPIDQESVCEATGQRVVGHVQLGVRDGRNDDRNNFIEHEPARSEELLRDRSDGEPQLTSCTDKFAGTIDYIWHTRQLRVRSLLDLPSLEQAMQGGGLPTTSYPSDHLSIMAELQWRRPEDDRGALPCE